MAKDENAVVNEQTVEQPQNMPDPTFLNPQEFSGLLNLLLINTKFFVATELKEKPKYEGDASIYLINILINNPVINVNSDLIQLLNKYSNNVQIINNADLKGYHTVGAEVYVKENAKPEEKVEE